MNSVCDVLLVVLVATKNPSPFLKFTVTDVTHSGGIVVLHVTLAPGVEPPTLSARTFITAKSEK